MAISYINLLIQFTYLYLKSSLESTCKKSSKWSNNWSKHWQGDWVENEGVDFYCGPWQSKLKIKVLKYWKSGSLHIVKIRLMANSLFSLLSLSLGVGKLTVFPDNEIILKSMEIFFFLHCTNFSAVAIHQHQFSVLVRHAFDVSNWILWAAIINTW